MNIKVKCDISGNELLIQDGIFVANMNTGEWYFCLPPNDEKIEQSYFISLSDFIESEADLIDKLVHLYRKAWFKPELFFSFLDKFKRENGFLGG